MEADKIKEVGRLRDSFFDFVGQTSLHPLAFSVHRASGVYLYDEHDRPILDMVAGLSVSSFGHGHPKIVAAIAKQARCYLHTMAYGEALMPIQIELARKIQATLPEPLDNVFFTNTGSEAVEAALKLCKRYTGRRRLASCLNAYHGSTHGALSVTGQESLKSAFRPLLPDILFLRHGNTDDLALIDDSVAGVIVEVVQGEAGVRAAEASYYRNLRQRCEEQGVLLVVDEVQTGFGRTGTFWAFEHYDTPPHIVLCAKAMAGGLPLGAFIASQKTMRALAQNPPLGHINTFGGNPVCCAAALAVLDILEEERLICAVTQKAEGIVKRLQHPAIVEVRHKGLMMAVELGDAALAHRVRYNALRRGLLVDTFLFCKTAIRLSPPLTITEKEMEKACHLLHLAIADSLKESPGPQRGKCAQEKPGEHE